MLYFAIIWWGMGIIGFYLNWRNHLRWSKCGEDYFMTILFALLLPPSLFIAGICYEMLNHI
jgi:hypothetical protein